jgi:hypothetical protein
LVKYFWFQTCDEDPEKSLDSFIEVVNKKVGESPITENGNLNFPVKLFLGYILISLSPQKFLHPTLHFSTHIKTFKKKGLSSDPGTLLLAPIENSM